jgi:hypothetical protein
MKKFLGVFSVVLLLLVLLPGPVEAQSRFGFKAYGGLNYLTGGDLNKGIVGWSDTLIDMFEAMTAYGDGEFLPVHLGMNFGGEFLFQFSPSMGVGLGVGYIQATKASDPFDLIPPAGAPEVSWKSNVSAIPITATFYYFLPTSSNLKFFLNVGLGYYLAKVDFDHNFWFLLPVNWEARTTGGGLGFHGGLGLEFALSPMLGIVAEVKGRYAAFSNFEGSVDWVWPGFPALNDTVEGPLWITDYSLFGLGTKPILWISELEPAGVPSKAKVDFSGFSFTVGFVVHF